MRSIKMTALGLALGLSLWAGTATRSAAEPPCEAQCHKDNGLCIQICRDNPCLISCEDQLRFCLEGCSAA